MIAITKSGSAILKQTFKQNKEVYCEVIASS